MSLRIASKRWLSISARVATQVFPLFLGGSAQQFRCVAALTSVFERAVPHKGERRLKHSDSADLIPLNYPNEASPRAWTEHATNRLQFSVQICDQIVCRSKVYTSKFCTLWIAVIGPTTLTLSRVSCTAGAGNILRQVTKSCPCRASTRNTASQLLPPSLEDACVDSTSMLYAPPTLPIVDAWAV